MPFGVGRTFDPKTILLSALEVQKKEASIHAKNLTMRDTPGYAKEDFTVNQLTLAGISAGVQISAVFQSVDEILIAQIRDQNSLVGEFQAIDDYLKKLDICLGDPKSRSSFAHLGKSMTDAMQSLAADPSNVGKRQEAIDAINKHVLSIVNLANQVQSIRAAVDAEISSCAVDVNTILNDLANNNSSLVKQGVTQASTVIFPLINARRQSLQDLSELLGVTVIPADSNQVTVLAKSGEVLVQGGDCATFSYPAAASVTATTTLSDLTITGFSTTPLIVTNTFQDSQHTGKFTALLTLRDKILPGLQQQLDEYTMQLRDSLNAIHNQGTSTNPPNTLTGTIGAPGVVGPLANGTVVSGAGNLRIAVIDPTTGNAVGVPADITLAANTTVGDLITSLNTAAAGSFTASLTSAGQLQIKAANSSYGIAIGASGTAPTMCAGATAPQPGALGFSHFFGLNNLIQTGTNLPTQDNTGISNLLSVRSDILTSGGQALAVGALNSSTPIGSPAIAPRDASIMNSLVLQMQASNITFSETGVSAQVQTSLLNYSNSIVDLYGAKIANNKKSLDVSQYTYEGLSTRANEISGVDPRQTIQQCIELSTSQNLILKALNIMIKMDEALLDIMN